ncbi:unnamed protein product [Rotaria magnacalcarata]|uniref:Reverse transcriptase n=1 Tax=Rotaria magnacalcarata TaxID=392030 RepID=A0A816R1L7_9BILA|nr:unnamed protein product [Rotaria magnacalcarata]CAF4059640.1 unnamed protein product [Rotaria magnacalcarata]
MIRNQDGTMQQSKEGVKQRRTQYCSGLYKDEGGGDEMVKELEGISPSYKEDPQGILYSEVEEAIRTLKSKKSPGSDGITAEMIQAGGEQLTHKIHSLCSKVWHEGVIPEEWGKSILIPIPKKGDLSECANYRTISLISHTEKNPTDSTVEQTQTPSVSMSETGQVQLQQVQVKILVSY